MSGPCEWNVSYAAATGCNAITDLPADERLVFEAIAVQYLWRWTGMKFGTCAVTVRPRRSDCPPSNTFSGPGNAYLPSEGAPWAPALVNGQWYNIGCSCGDICSCDRVQQIALPGPIASIEEVVIDGALLQSTAYRVDNGNLLVRIDGQAWPTCNDLSQDSSIGLGATGTWEVTYKQGLPVPVGGQVAAGILATEFAKAAGDKDCALPKRVQSVTRQGITVAVLDNFDDIQVGHTGIWLVDSWVASVTKAPHHSRVYSPDVKETRRTTWQT
jgi:hypothetical protein